MVGSPVAVNQAVLELAVAVPTTFEHAVVDRVMLKHDVAKCSDSTWPLTGGRNEKGLVIADVPLAAEREMLELVMVE